VVGVAAVEAIHDKGEGRGAVLVLKQDVRNAADNRLIATNRARVFLRADGGFGGTDNAPKPHPIPERTPDIVVMTPTRPEQALIYRLTGDWIPLHVDPVFARRAGFKGPILHGMATYGLAGYTILRQLCGGEPARLKRLDARFSSPVYPGDLLTMEIWKESDGEAAYRCLVGDKVVLNNGYVRYQPG
jgi:acyl dehydratase